MNALRCDDRRVFALRCDYRRALCTALRWPSGICASLRWPPCTPIFFAEHQLINGDLSEEQMFIFKIKIKSVGCVSIHAVCSASWEHPSKFSRAPIHQWRPKRKTIDFQIKQKQKKTWVSLTFTLCALPVWNITAISAENQFINGDLSGNMFIFKTKIKQKKNAGFVNIHSVSNNRAACLL